MITVTVNGYTNDRIESWMFPAGEHGVRVIGDFKPTDSVVVYLHYQTDAEMLRLALIKDALDRAGVKDIRLDIPYFPYARQDRVCNKGESHSLKVVADFINSLNFDEVVVWDPHSTVLEAVVDRLKVRKQEYAQSRARQWLTEHNYLPENTVLVAPDAGAAKKVYDVAKCWGYDKVLTCFKRRDLSNGNIIDTYIPLTDKVDYNMVVIDDILDGGRTFLELAPLLKDKTSGDLILSVTHGIFSKGIAPFGFSCYSKILVANMMNRDIDVKHPLLDVNS